MEDLANKSVLVLGLGKSGESAALLLRSLNARVTAVDSGESPALQARAELLTKAGVRVLLGSAATSDSTTYDLGILSPGIDPVIPLVQTVVDRKIPIIGELELAFRYCQSPVIAITGTNGKTTTTELTTWMFANCGLKAKSAGNIGLPFTAVAAESADLDVVVVEVSSFQLETIKTFRPKIAAWLNFSANHLDRYPGIQEYYDAKLRIFENQTAEDFAVVNLRSELPALKARPLTFSAFDSSANFHLRGTDIYFGERKVLDQTQTQLPGVHNAENLMSALAIGHAFGLDFAAMAQAVKGYHAPEHRCELTRELDGVVYINDSKSTNLDALEKAILAQDRRIVLISGGKDKGFEFAAIAPLVAERVKHAVLIGEMRERIRRDWPGVATELAVSLPEAVALAQQSAEAGDVVLFSPGTSSFDMFSSYIERGQKFKTAVHQLSPKTTKPTTTSERNQP